MDTVMIAPSRGEEVEVLAMAKRRCGELPGSGGSWEAGEAQSRTGAAATRRQR